jgi:hypothetical protein
LDKVEKTFQTVSSLEYLHRNDFAGDYSDVGGVLAGSEGRLFVMLNHERLIRVYDSVGTIVRDLGGVNMTFPGFRSFGRMGFSGDSSWVADPQQNSIILFGPQLSIARIIKVRLEPPRPRYAAAPPLAYVGSDTVLVEFHDSEPRSVSAGDQSKLLMRAHSSGTLIDTVVMFSVPAAPLVSANGVRFRAERPLPMESYFALSPTGEEIAIVERPAPTRGAPAEWHLTRRDLVTGKRVRTRYAYSPVRTTPESLATWLELPQRARGLARRFAQARIRHAILPEILSPGYWYRDWE